MKINITHQAISLFSAGIVAAFSLLTPAIAADKGALTSKDKAFINEATEGGLTEIQMGEMGKEKATNADVKSVAEMLVTDHTKANAELKKIATAKGAEVPDSPGATQKANLMLLKTKKGASFDAAFADDSVKDHKATIALFEKAAKELDDPDLKAFAEKTLPTLKEHLAMSERAAASATKEKAKADKS